MAEIEGMHGTLANSTQVPIHSALPMLRTELWELALSSQASEAPLPLPDKVCALLTSAAMITDPARQDAPTEDMCWLMGVFALSIVDARTPETVAQIVASITLSALATANARMLADSSSSGLADQPLTNMELLLSMHVERVAQLLTPGKPLPVPVQELLCVFCAGARVHRRSDLQSLAIDFGTAVTVCAAKGDVSLLKTYVRTIADEVVPPYGCAYRTTVPRISEAVLAAIQNFLLQFFTDSTRSLSLPDGLSETHVLALQQAAQLWGCARGNIPLDDSCRSFLGQCSEIMVKAAEWVLEGRVDAAVQQSLAICLRFLWPAVREWNDLLANAACNKPTSFVVKTLGVCEMISGFLHCARQYHLAPSTHIWVVGSTLIAQFVLCVDECFCQLAASNVDAPSNPLGLSLARKAIFHRTVEGLVLLLKEVRSLNLVVRLPTSKIYFCIILLAATMLDCIICDQVRVCVVTFAEERLLHRIRPSEPIQAFPVPLEGARFKLTNPVYDGQSCRADTLALIQQALDELCLGTQEAEELFASRLKQWCEMHLIASPGVVNRHVLFALWNLAAAYNDTPPAPIFEAIIAVCCEATIAADHSVQAVSLLLSFKLIAKADVTTLMAYKASVVDCTSKALRKCTSSATALLAARNVQCVCASLTHQPEYPYLQQGVLRFLCHHIIVQSHTIKPTLLFGLCISAASCKTALVEAGMSGVLCNSDVSIALGARLLHIILSTCGARARHYVSVVAAGIARARLNHELYKDLDYQDEESGATQIFRELLAICKRMDADSLHKLYSDERIRSLLQPFE